jgi:protein-L-isoaspartate(D-aspartate) O-methyltransferase
VDAHDPFAEMREAMVVEQIMRRGLRDPRLLEAFRRIPRHEFVPPALRSRAYDDGPLPIGKGQTISQPFIVALMTSLLNLKGDETVLEVGTGSGYQAAILSLLARWVYTIERHEVLAERARATFHRLGLKNITVICGDGTLGYPEAAPYQGIIVTAAAASPPPPLLEQLDEGGRLVIPVGDYTGQILQVWTKEGGRLDYEDILPVSFVPLRGRYGWSPRDWERFEEEDGESEVG